MNIADRKQLTEYLGECWHEQDCNIYHPFRCSCGEEFHIYAYKSPLDEHIKNSNRTFTTAQDMVDLSNELGECGQWREFYGYCFKPFIDSNPLKAAPSDMCLWLITNPIRTCELIAEYLRKESK